MAWTAERRQAASERAKKSWSDPEIRKRRSEAIRNAWTPEKRARASEQKIDNDYGSHVAWTEEERDRQSKAMQGNKNGRGNKGKIWSEEQKRNHVGMTGRTASPETRRKMSESHKKLWASYTPEQISALIEKQQKVSFKPTNIERITQEILDSEGIAFVIHPWVRVEYGGVKRVFRPDLLLPASNLIVEV